MYIRLANGQLVCIAHMPYASPERLKHNKFMLASLHLFRPVHIQSEIRRDNVIHRFLGRDDARHGRY